MEELQRLLASRRGHRGHLTKLFKKSEEFFANQNGMTELLLASASTTLDQLKRKAEKLRELDEQIVHEINDAEELEREIEQEEEIQQEIEDTGTKLSVIINTGITSAPNISTAPSTSSIATSASYIAQITPSTSSTVPNTSPAPQNMSPIDQTTSSVMNPTTVAPPPGMIHPSPSPSEPSASANPFYPQYHQVQAHVPAPMNFGHTFSRLPKLNLPVFGGEPLEWLSFWDSFDVGVHRKPGLPEVDKFNYLRAQLTGEAIRAIAGYPITCENYTRAIITLKERFGQPHKITNAHMSALLELPHPSNHLDSLCSFYDTMETHIRALEALGKSQETFGDLLVPVILGKLPDETKRNLARSQQGQDWNIQDLRQALKHELKVLEAGTTPLLDATPTANFFTGVRGSQSRGKGNSKSRSCPFCQGNHTANNCTVVVDPKTRKSIIFKGGLCYNCLSSSHRSAKCSSKYRCRHCGGKHHTTICEGDKQKGPPQPPPGNHEPLSPTQGESQSVHATLTPAQQNMVHEYPILLKTAISHVKVGGISREANILLDEGAQRTFITKDLADELGAKQISKENISMSAFGATEHSLRRLDVTTIDIISEQGDKIPVRASCPSHRHPLAMSTSHRHQQYATPKESEISAPSV